MRRQACAAVLAAMLLVPASAMGQTQGNIVLLDTFGVLDRGESLFLYGQISRVSDGSFIIVQVANPRGDLCQIQQLLPLADGAFVTGKIPLSGRLCGQPGQYQVTVFYNGESESSKLELTSSAYAQPSKEQYAKTASGLVSSIVQSLGSGIASVSGASSYESRIEAAAGTPDPVSALRQIYVDIMTEHGESGGINEIGPLFRLAAQSFLDASASLEESGKISAAQADDLDKRTYSAAFYYEIGDREAAIDGINDVFKIASGADPAEPQKRSLTYDELEESLINLLGKTSSVMSRDVKEELSIIFSRGLGPVYVEELDSLLDIGTQSRYLDVILRKDSRLYNLVQAQWEPMRSSLVSQDNIADLVAKEAGVARLHEATLLLRELDDVSRLVSSPSGDSQKVLAELINPDYESLIRDMETASSVDDILEARERINDMVSIIEISSRIARVIDIAQKNGIDSSLTGSWDGMLERVSSASSAAEVLEIVTEFDSTLTSLREKRDPAAILLFEYQTLRSQAESQADYTNIALIDEALKVLRAAQLLSDAPSSARADRTELLLSWASSVAPKIRADLNAYSEKQFKMRASEILQRANSLEALSESGLNKNRFLPGYLDFVEDIQSRVDNIRDLALTERLYEANALLDDLYDEWQTVTLAYAEDPSGSKVGYNIPELQRIKFYEKIQDIEDMVARFADEEFQSDHGDDYREIISSANLNTQIGNFADANDRIIEAGRFIAKYLVSGHDDIMYELEYDPATHQWTATGYINNENGQTTSLPDVKIEVFEQNGDSYASREIYSTDDGGKFHTIWNDDAEPGLYVVTVTAVLHGASSTRVAYVEDRDTYVPPSGTPDTAEAARLYEDLESFIMRFGGSNYAARQAQFDDLLSDIREFIADGEARSAEASLVQLQLLIERYLPARAPSAVIQASYESGRIDVQGAVKKDVAFSEDLYVDIYDQRGEEITTIAIQDTDRGYFDESIYRTLGPGIYVAQLQYHDLYVADFFLIR